MISLIYSKIYCLKFAIYSFFVLLTIRLIFKTSGKALVILIPTLFFEGTTHVYLLKKSIIHNKNWKPLLNVIINCISARSVPEILPIKDECALLFLNYLIIGFCNSSATSWTTKSEERWFGNYFTLNNTTWSNSIEKFVNHWSKSTLISTIIWIFSNSKCFII